MNCIHIVQPKTRYMGRLSRGSDILKTVNELCRREGIRLGRLEAIGAVEKAHLGYYDQQVREYRYNELDRPLEITSLSGNISLRDGDPFVHAHITLADSDGRTYGGHLAEGNIAFACEFMVEVFEGPILERRFNEETDLYLWEPSS